VIKALPWSCSRFSEALFRLYSLSSDESPELFLLLSLLYYSAENGHYHICLEQMDAVLSELIAMTGEENNKEELKVKGNELVSLLKMNNSLPGLSVLAGGGEDKKPLVIEILQGKSFLYLNKFNQAENRTSRLLKAFLQENELFSSQSVSNVRDSIWIKQLTESRQKGLVSLLSGRFFLVSGGPGTGKTTFTAFALKGWINCFREKNSREPFIKMAAPTGRAAFRMKESLYAADIRFTLGLSDAGDFDTSTLHRLLKITQNRMEGSFNEDHPLPVDLLIIDEVSMVDMGMMLKVLRALPQGTSLILIGDHDQLPAVEAGSFLHDLMENIDKPGHAFFNRYLMLEGSYRSVSDILELAEKFRTGSYKTADDKSGLVRSLTGEAVNGMINDNLRSYKKLKTFSFSLAGWKQALPRIEEIWNLMLDFIILCPLKKGYWGTASINEKLSARFRKSSGDVFFHGQPVIITANDYENNLFNGDRGFIAFFRSEYAAVFEDTASPDRFRIIPLSRLRKYETAFAITIHKSQGSEFNKAVLIIPQEAEKLLSREIIYTGITRAKNSVTLFAEENVLELAASKSMRRHSGLSEKLEITI